MYDLTWQGASHPLHSLLQSSLVLYHSLSRISRISENSEHLHSSLQPRHRLLRIPHTPPQVPETLLHPASGFLNPGDILQGNQDTCIVFCSTSSCSIPTSSSSKFSLILVAEART